MALFTTLLRYWPFENGSGRIIDKFATKVDLGTGERLAQTTDGFGIHVFADDLIGRHLLMSGRFDRSIVQVLIDHAKPGDVLLDIGANIGYVSACFLANVPGSSAVCIEPQPLVIDLLRKNLEQFDAEVMQIGLADRDGMLRFHIDADNKGASRVSNDGETEIPVRDAGRLLESLACLDIIKIDVEGMEEPIFRSMANQLKRLKPRAILFEDQTASAAPDGNIGSVLTGLGYRIFGIDKRLMKTALVPIRTAAGCRFNDYLATA